MLDLGITQPAEKVMVSLHFGSATQGPNKWLTHASHRLCLFLGLLSFGRVLGLRTRSSLEELFVGERAGPSVAACTALAEEARQRMLDLGITQPAEKVMVSLHFGSRRVLLAPDSVEDRSHRLCLFLGLLSFGRVLGLRPAR
jgi:hypothetical protein